ncbi:MAG: alpha-xylosidase [Prevotella sp.]|nr:alpha-xylosidase [Prevotella sp.]
MKQTNYHLFDFMDFDPTMQREEALWKAYAPTTIVERDGDIVVTIPYQQQRHQEDMDPDTEAAQQSYDLIIRAYEPNIIRLFTTMTDDQMTESDEMLLMAPEVKRKPLRYVDGDVIATDGTKVANINLSEPRLDPWSDLLPAPQPAPLITFYPDGDTSKPVALSDDHFSPPRYDALPLGFCSVCCNDTATKNERATISFKCDADEHFVGTGERFRKMDLSGQTFQLKNQDGQGVNNRRCYKNIPFYLSSRMYGVFFHTSDYCKLSLADHSSRSVQFLCDHATLDVFLIGGQTPEEILKGYRMLTGFPAMPPLWSFGIWMSRMTYFSADEVEDICNRLRQEHYPCDVIHLDTGWFRTDWLCEWRFNPERFPDPKGFISRLKENGFKVSLWQLPYIAQGAEQLEEAKKNHYISQPTKEEETSTGGASNFSALDYAGTIDFTYPKATDWYKYSLLKPLLDMGVKCIKTDFGENIHMDHQYHSSSPERLNNIYALLYQKAAYEVTREVAGDGIIWARAGWAGCQRYPLHWGGDSESSWAGMAGSLKGGLHLGLSGFAFWSHDVPGFHSTPDFMNSPLDEQVYVRWTQFGVFTSHMRYHGTCKREPWHYPNIAPIVKRWWKLRYRLIPYIIEQSELACKSGLPIVQALLIHHPNDRQVWHIDDEYYFGNEFLVCPVMNAENRRDIYLPEGQWVHFLTGERLEGGRWYDNIEVPLDEMPVFVRPDARIKMYPHDVDSTDDMDLEKAITIEITKEYKGI